MDASTQTEVGRKSFAQQTDGGKGEWVKEDKEVEIVREIKGRKDEEDVAIIAVFCPIASNKKTRDVKTQTASSTKEKGMQTEWMLHVIEVEESRRSNRDLLLRYIQRQWDLIEVREAFKVPAILSPIREVEDKGEEWKKWGPGEFVWIEDDKENDKNNDNEKKKEETKKKDKENTGEKVNNKDVNEKKRKRNENNGQQETKRIKEEAERKDKENIENKNDNNENKRKRTSNDGEKQVKKIKKGDEEDNDNEINNEKKGKKNDNNGQQSTRKVKEEDLQTLEGTRWLNDEIINSYFDLISKERTFGQRVYAMSSFFFPRLHLNGYEAVRRWTKKINIFKYDKVLVPVHLGNHWCLAIINFENKTIIYYDSFKGKNPRYLETLLQYLIKEAGQKEEKPIIKEEWHLATKQDIPRQTNGYDCGVFVCMYARNEIFGGEMDFTQNDMPQVRQRMMRELQAGNIEI
ncbi:sentrin-specific protease-like [Venturia canescens]|uniref:sentrin-specific protease-like n=1 Tax=Venturia canescens TaxID=32260 RepID=UPI001C9CD250|nr:sentrin-specific protease-like [Venturia canescens]XP_043275308.1 sentrin-specific protease-like [Venturia canescens]